MLARILSFRISIASTFILITCVRHLADSYVFLDTLIPTTRTVARISLIGLNLQTSPMPSRTRRTSTQKHCSVPLDPSRWKSSSKPVIASSERERVLRTGMARTGSLKWRNWSMHAGWVSRIEHNMHHFSFYPHSCTFTTPSPHAHVLMLVAFAFSYR